ncbi:hypothetical protein Btru_001812 [Bulinus truncatus]|nr:hypothetical protein Btru_001812 [Bulinus truncatus]
MIPVQESSGLKHLMSVTHAPVNESSPNSDRPSFTQLGITLDKPKKFDLATKEARLRTFDRYPANHPIDTEDLAEAGFYYAGFEDCSRCFFCGGGLKNWDSSDDVIVEHARWFPKCSYIRQMKGQEFVDAVQRLHLDYEQITYKMVLESMGSLGPAFNVDIITDKCCDSAVKALVELGCDTKTILQAAEDLHRENGSCFTSDVILDRIQENCNEACQKNQRLDSTNFQSIESVQDDITSIKRTNQELRNLATCKICMDRSIAVVFLPCSHFVSCLDCSMAFRRCPLCRDQHWEKWLKASTHYIGRSGSRPLLITLGEVAQGLYSLHWEKWLKASAHG